MTGELRIRIECYFLGAQQGQTLTTVVGNVFAVSDGNPSKRDVLIPAGWEATPASLALPAGRYVVQADLPSGQILTEEAELADGASASVELDLADSPFESHALQFLLGDIEPGSVYHGTGSYPVPNSDGSRSFDRRPGATGTVPVINNFDYGSDEDGSKCPFHAHIRKSNPRGFGGSPGGNPTNVPFERSHIMARRGQTYGQRSDIPDADLPPSARPTGGVGLLFMAFNSDIDVQFEFTQQAWINNPDFPFTSPTPAGLDPVIGQGSRPPTNFPTKWGEDERKEVDTVAQAVTMKGGQYFFFPSLAFLGQL